MDRDTQSPVVPGSIGPDCPSDLNERFWRQLWSQRRRRQRSFLGHHREVSRTNRQLGSAAESDPTVVIQLKLEWAADPEDDVELSSRFVYDSEDVYRGRAQSIPASKDGHCNAPTANVPVVSPPITKFTSPAPACNPPDSHCDSSEVDVDLPRTETVPGNHRAKSACRVAPDVLRVTIQGILQQRQAAARLIYSSSKAQLVRLQHRDIRIIRSGGCGTEKTQMSEVKPGSRKEERRSGRDFDQPPVVFHEDNFAVSLLYSSSAEGEARLDAEFAGGSPQSRPVGETGLFDIEEEETHCRCLKQHRNRSCAVLSRAKPPPRISRHGAGPEEDRIVLTRCAKSHNVPSPPAPPRRVRRRKAGSRAKEKSGGVFLEQMTLQDYMRRGMVGLPNPNQAGYTEESKPRNQPRKGRRKRRTTIRCDSTISKGSSVLFSRETHPEYLALGRVDSCMGNSMAETPTAAEFQGLRMPVGNKRGIIRYECNQKDKSRNCVSTAGTGVAANSSYSVKMAAERRQSMDTSTGSDIDWARTGLFRRVESGRVYSDNIEENARVELEIDTSVLALENGGGTEIAAALLGKAYATYKRLTEEILGRAMDFPEDVLLLERLEGRRVRS